MCSRSCLLYTQEEFQLVKSISSSKHAKCQINSTIKFPDTLWNDQILALRNDLPSVSLENLQ